MAWALQLQQSLRTGTASQAFADDNTFDYQTIAFEALHVAEAPILPVLSHEALPSRTRQSENRAPETSLPSSLPDSPALEALPSGRTSSRSTRVRGQHVGPRAPTKKLMYLRNTAHNPPTLAKLACPDCSRSDMTNVQGLYNHCRLRHKREFGSHDECIRASAVRVPPEEETWVIENGIELPGINLPSLRSLFEMAVGAETKPEGRSPSPTPRLGDGTSTSTHISRTLGHHLDTPALAPFLGREVKRRAIAVHAEDDEVDIENVPSTDLRGWRKPYMHRNKAIPAFDVASSKPEADYKPSSVVAQPEIDSAVLQLPSALPATGSRFHFIARITIGDHSLWLPPRTRDTIPEGHTHRCMVYVDSPSYSLHASAFISQVSVRSLTEPPPPTLREPVVVSTYPFVTLITTDSPFLAEITISIVGERNPDLVIQHWVELDPFKHEKSVLGDEQVVDVELDRSTQYRSPQPQINPADLLNSSKQRVLTNSASAKSTAQEVLPYVRLLKTLLPRFPMTSRDAKGISTSHLPYKLFPSPQALPTLVDGRRKAIERARAQALCEAYARARSALSPQEASKYLELNIADVYIWLEDGGHFLRPPPVQPSLPTTEDKGSDIDTPRSKNGFCSVCGVSIGLHPQLKAEDGSLEPPALCPHTPPAPHLLVLDPLRSMNISGCPSFSPGNVLDGSKHSAQDILHSADPRLIDATSRITDALHLPQPLTMAGSATLALAARAYVRHLLNISTDLARNDRIRTLGSDAAAQQLLVPGHIFRAMDSERAMRIVGSVLGNARSFPVVATRSRSQRPEEGVAVKQELEE